jgi:hypothetical protein
MVDIAIAGGIRYIGPIGSPHPNIIRRMHRYLARWELQSGPLYATIVDVHLSD